MIYVFPQGNIVYDGSTISDEQKAYAVAVESLPEPQTLEGKYGVLMADKANETVYYEYKDIPEDPEVEQLKRVVADLTELILFGGVE